MITSASTSSDPRGNATRRSSSSKRSSAASTTFFSAVGVSPLFHPVISLRLHIRGDFLTCLLLPLQFAVDTASPRGIATSLLPLLSLAVGALEVYCNTGPILAGVSL